MADDGGETSVGNLVVSVDWDNAPQKEGMEESMQLLDEYNQKTAQTMEAAHSKMSYRMKRRMATMFARELGIPGVGEVMHMQHMAGMMGPALGAGAVAAFGIAVAIGKAREQHDELKKQAKEYNLELTRTANKWADIAHQQVVSTDAGKHFQEYLIQSRDKLLEIGKAREEFVSKIGIVQAAGVAADMVGNWVTGEGGGLDKTALGEQHKLFLLKKKEEMEVIRILQEALQRQDAIQRQREMIDNKQLVASARNTAQLRGQRLDRARLESESEAKMRAIDKERQDALSTFDTTRQLALQAAQTKVDQAKGHKEEQAAIAEYNRIFYGGAKERQDIQARFNEKENAQQEANKWDQLALERRWADQQLEDETALNLARAQVWERGMRQEQAMLDIKFDEKKRLYEESGRDITTIQATHNYESMALQEKYNQKFRDNIELGKIKMAEQLGLITALQAKFQMSQYQNEGVDPDLLKQSASMDYVLDMLGKGGNSGTAMTYRHGQMSLTGGAMADLQNNPINQLIKKGESVIQAIDRVARAMTDVLR